MQHANSPAFQPVTNAMLVTPSDARRMLENAGVDHEKIGSAKYVRSLEAQILSGRWMLNGEAIILGNDNSVLDGKRRLAACIRSNSSFPAILVCGIDPSASPTINAHKKRTARDVMHIQRIESPSEKIATATMLRAMALGVEHYDSGNLSIGPDFVKSLFDRHPDLVESILAARPVHTELGFGLSLLAAGHFMFSTVNMELARKFFDDVADPLSSHKVVRALKRIAEEYGKSRRVPRRMQVAALIKAWNAYRDGGARPNLRMLDDERMPVISGSPVVELPGNEVDPVDIPARDRDEVYRKIIEAANEENLRIRVHTFTPAEAAEILKTGNGPSFSGINRAISASKVRVFTRDMLSGSWRMNGQAVKFGKSGRLIDGQHRLSACVEADKPMTSVVIEGIEDEAFSTIDQGTHRNLRQAIKNLGVPSYSLVNDVAVVLWRWENGFLGKSEAPSISEGLDVVRRWIGRIQEANRMFTFKTRTREIMTEAQACWLHLILREKDRADADRFMQDLLSTCDTGEGDPVRPLRELFIRGERVRDGLRSNGRLRERNVAFMTFSAWNIRREGKKHTRKSFSIDDPRPIPALV